MLYKIGTLVTDENGKRRSLSVLQECPEPSTPRKDSKGSLQSLGGYMSDPQLVSAIYLSLDDYGAKTKNVDHFFVYVLLSKL